VNELLDTIISGNDLTFHLGFQRDEESGWFVAHVFELPGCVSQGATIGEAKINSPTPSGPFWTIRISA